MEEILGIDPETSSKEEVLADLLRYCHIQDIAIQKALNQYEVKHILWSKREEYASHLAMV